MTEIPELVSEIGWQVIRSTLVVLGLLLLRLATKRYVPAKWLYLICVFGCLWLLVPVTPSSWLSIWRSVPVTSIDAKSTSGQTREDALIGESMPLSFPNPLTRSQVLTHSPKPEDVRLNNLLVDLNSNPKKAPSWLLGILTVWGTGALILMLAWLSREAKIRIQVRLSQLGDSSKLLRLLTESKAILGINHNVGIVVLKSHRSPALTGVLRPVIVVGEGFESELSDKQIKHVFLHELAHLKRGDLLTRILCKISFLVQWPNPVAWWLAKASLDDMEIATDQLVLQHLSNEEEQHSYGDTLLKIARSLSQSYPLLHSHLLGMVPPYQSNLETRIRMIANHNELKIRKWPLVLVIISAVFISILIGFKPASAQSDSEEVEPVPAKVRNEEKTRQVYEIEEKLKTISIPAIDFSDTKLSDALAFVQKVSKEQDESGSGVTITFSDEARVEFGDKPITLRLSNAPLAVALRYMTDLAQVRYRIQPDGVEIRKRPDLNDLYNNVYVVPPTFVNLGGVDGDPFAAPGGSLIPRKTAKEILETAGIMFGKGCSAIYNPATSHLTVRNTQDQMELVEAYIESIKAPIGKQIYVTIKEIQVDPEFTFGEKDEFFESLLTLPPLPEYPEANRAVVFDSRESFLREFSKPPSKPDDKRERIGRKVDGVLTDPQFQVLMKALKEQKDIEILNAPSIMGRSGQLSMSQANGRRYGVSTVLGADGYTIDLQIFLATPDEALFEEGDALTTPYKLTIWDGQIVILAERRESGKGRFVFVKAQIMDPAGMPIHGKNEKKAAKVMVNPTFQAEVAKADGAALLGSQLMADGNYSKAAGKYSEALKALPVHEMTVPRRKVYEQQLALAQKRL